MRIILPKTYHSVDLTYGPLFFLAGPVRGGGDWQAECCAEISKHFTNFYAVLPCPYEMSHPLQAFKVAGKQNFFDRQLPWERYYLGLAATHGCLLFWLPAESKINPRLDGPYAQDTYGELGEWRGRLMYEPTLRIVIGAEPNFPGLSQIQRNFNQATGTDFPIYNTLEKTVAMAVEKVK
jgi:hypothetical protein